jgi:hypothetical protein
MLIRGRRGAMGPPVILKEAPRDLLVSHCRPCAD